LGYANFGGDRHCGHPVRADAVGQTKDRRHDFSLAEIGGLAHRLAFYKLVIDY